MKKVSTASFIVGVVLIVASIVLFILGVLNVKTPYAYSRSINGYTFTKVSYSISVTGIINGFMMIIFGGIAFLSGFLSFILAAVTRGPKFPKPACGHEHGPAVGSKCGAGVASAGCAGVSSGAGADGGASAASGATAGACATAGSCAGTTAGVAENVASEASSNY